MPAAKTRELKLTQITPVLLLEGIGRFPAFPAVRKRRLTAFVQQPAEHEKEPHALLHLNPAAPPLRNGLCRQLCTGTQRSQGWDEGIQLLCGFLRIMTRKTLITLSTPPPV